MSVELIKKPITLDEMTKRETVQVIKERDLIVPDGKPDLQCIVQMDGEVCIDQIDVSQDRVMYRGKIDVCILYRTIGNQKCIYTMKSSIPVEDFVIIEGVNKDQRIDFDCKIEHMSYNILNERKVNVKAIMEINVAATSCKDTTVITEIQADGPVETKEEEIEIVSLANEKEEKIIVKEDLTIAASKPCIGEILKTIVSIQDEQVKRTDSEIKYNGMIEVVTMYKAADSDDDIEIITHRVPFEGSIESPQEEDEMYFDCQLSAELSYIQVAPDYDGEDRIIECEFIVNAKYCSYSKTIYETVSDIYCPGKKVKTKEKTLDYMNLKDKVHVAIPKKEAITLDDDFGESPEIFSINVKPTVEDKAYNDGILTVSGMLEIKILYLCKTGENNEIQMTMNVVPFTQEVETAMSQGKIVVEPIITAKDVSVYAQTKREVVIEYLLDCMIEVYEAARLNVLEEVDLEDMTKEEMDAYPSMTVYQVKKGDSLWSLAKRYNTTVKDIQELNDIEVPESLREGQKVIILKKVKF
jgi:LysM repeat protein